MPADASRLIPGVEDDDAVREFAVHVLRDRGYAVIEAVNGGVALVLLEQDLPIDLLFTDIVMPGEPDGVALAERAKELRPNLRVLYTTGVRGPRPVPPAADPRQGPRQPLSLPPIGQRGRAAALRLRPTDRGPAASG